MDSIKRLQKAINDLKKLNPEESQKVILKNLGYASSNYLSDVLNGNKPISAKFLSKLEERYLVSKNWILTGHGQQFLTPEVYYNQERSKYYLPPNVRKYMWEILNYLVYEAAQNRAHYSKRPFDDCLAEIFGEINLICK